MTRCNLQVSRTQTPTPTPATTAAGKRWTYRQSRRCQMPSSLSISSGPTGQLRKLGAVPRARERESSADSTKVAR
eukprot:4963874-Lingulodinium_polyedra.AAC.1